MRQPARRACQVGAYAELVRTARAAGVPVLLDTSGEPLRRGIAARPDLVKPNADELAELTGSREPLRATQDARRRGRPRGGRLARPGRPPRGHPRGHAGRPPRRARVLGNPTGAGDSAVAGLLSGLVECLPWPDRLARAVALVGGDGPGAGGGRVRPGRPTRNCCRRITVTEQAPAA